MSRPKVILFDLDDTLYGYVAAEAIASRALFDAITRESGLDRATIEAQYRRARDQVKARIPGRGSSHSRLLYLSEFAHEVTPSLLPRVRSWEHTYWSDLITNASLREGAYSLIERAHSAGIKIAIVTDLTLQVQLWKLEALGLLPLVDALVASEEVEHDKPSAGAFTLALKRLKCEAHDCVMIGDSDEKDGAGASSVGIPYVRIDTGDGQGTTFPALAAQWELS